MSTEASEIGAAAAAPGAPAASSLAIPSVAGVKRHADDSTAAFKSALSGAGIGVKREGG